MWSQGVTSRKTCPLRSTPMQQLSPTTGWWLRGYWEDVFGCVEWRVHDGNHDVAAEVTAEFAVAIRCRTVELCELFFIRFHLPSLMWTSVILRALWAVVLYCISSCDWIERLWLICNFATGWWLGCDCAMTSSCAHWRGHVLSHYPVVQVAASCRLPVQWWIYGFLCIVWRVRRSSNVSSSKLYLSHSRNAFYI
jgi:hypothetical protein